MKKTLAIVLCIAMALTCAFAQGQTEAAGSAVSASGFNTNETLTFVIAGSTGGGSDLASRTYGEGLERLYGMKINYQTMKNTAGHNAVKVAKPDGNTITYVAAALMTQYVTGSADVDPMKDLTVIACVNDGGYSTIVVPANAPYDTFEDFVAYAKANPGKLNAGMPANGSNTFVFGALETALGITLNHVECASESDRLTNVAGGFIDVGLVNLGNAESYEKAGKLKVLGTVAGDGITLASTGKEDLPERYKTLQERGYKDCYVLNMNYIVGPAGMDPEQVKNMNLTFKALLEDPTVKAGIENIGLIPQWFNVEDSRRIYEEEYESKVQTAKNIGMYAL